MFSSFSSLIEQIIRTKLFCKSLKSNLLLVPVSTLSSVETSTYFACLLDWTERLERSIQFPEFTDHGLNHILSLAKRVSLWTIESGEYLVDQLTNDECLALASVILLHDMGMLSQELDDLPPRLRTSNSQYLTDLPMWVRKTHVPRIELLFKRLLKESHVALYNHLEATGLFDCIVNLAKSHSEWPDKTPHPIFDELNADAAASIHSDEKRLKGLAAILAVIDLLDEEHSRLDAIALLEHKAGNAINKSHWIRHYLVKDSLYVTRGNVVNIGDELYLHAFPDWLGQIEASKIALENHLLQVEKYYSTLLPLGFHVVVPDANWKMWESMPFKSTHSNLRHFSVFPDLQLIRSFDRELVKTTPLNVRLGKGYKACTAIHEQMNEWLHTLPDDTLEPVITLRAARVFGRDVTKAIDIAKEEIDKLRAFGRIADAKIISHEVIYGAR